MCNTNSINYDFELFSLQKLSLVFLILFLSLNTNISYSQQISPEDETKLISQQEGTFVDGDGRKIRDNFGIMPGMRAWSPCEGASPPPVCDDRSNYPINIEVDITQPPSARVEEVTTQQGELIIPAGTYYDSTGNIITPFDNGLVTHFAEGEPVQYSGVGNIYPSPPVSQTYLPGAPVLDYSAITVPLSAGHPCELDANGNQRLVDLDQNGDPVFDFVVVGGECRQVFYDENGVLMDSSYPANSTVPARVRAPAPQAVYSVSCGCSLDGAPYVNRTEAEIAADADPTDTLERADIVCLVPAGLPVAHPPTVGATITNQNCEPLQDACGNVALVGDPILLPDPNDITNCIEINGTLPSPVVSVRDADVTTTVQKALFTKRFSGNYFDAAEEAAYLNNPNDSTTLTLINSFWNPSSNLYKTFIDVREEGVYACVYAYFEDMDVEWIVKKDNFVLNYLEVFGARSFRSEGESRFIKLRSDGYRDFCFKLPPKAPPTKQTLDIEILDEICLDYDSSNDIHWVAPFISIPSQCIYNTMLNIFVVSGDFGQSGGNSFSFFKYTQLLFRDIVFAIFVLYVVIFGYRLITYKSVPDQKEWLWFGVKIAILFYFALGNGMSFLFPQVLAISNSLAIIFIQAFFDNVSNYNYCNFVDTGHVYTAGSEITQMWDVFDCKFSKYLGVAEDANNITRSRLLWLSVISLISTGFGLLIFTLSIAVVISIVSLVIRVGHIYFLTLVGLVILFFISPIIVLTTLFKFTSDMFNKWLQAVFGYVLQPVMMFALLTVFFLVLDFVYFGDNRNFVPHPQLVGETVVDYKIAGAGGAAATDPSECIDPEAIGCLIQTIPVFEKEFILGAKVLQADFGAGTDLGGRRASNYTFELLKLFMIFLILSVNIGFIERLIESLVGSKTSFGGDAFPSVSPNAGISAVGTTASVGIFRSRQVTSRFGRFVSSEDKRERNLKRNKKSVRRTNSNKYNELLSNLENKKGKTPAGKNDKPAGKSNKPPSKKGGRGRLASKVGKSAFKVAKTTYKTTKDTSKTAGKVTAKALKKTPDSIENLIEKDAGDE